MFRTGILRIAIACALFSALASNSCRAAEAAYEGQLIRLAEIFGSLHYLRNLCGENSDAWRARMQAMLEAENPDPARSSRLVASFNHGYRSFDSIYASCTPSAVAAIDRYLDEGKELTRDTIARFGN